MSPAVSAGRKMLWEVDVMICDDGEGDVQLMGQFKRANPRRLPCGAPSSRGQTTTFLLHFTLVQPA